MAGHLQKPGIHHTPHTTRASSQDASINTSCAQAPPWLTTEVPPWGRRSHPQLPLKHTAQRKAGGRFPTLASLTMRDLEFGLRAWILTAVRLGALLGSLTLQCP